MKVAVAAVGPELQSAAAVESAASLVVETETEIHTLLLEQFMMFYPIIYYLHKRYITINHFAKMHNKFLE